MKKLDRYIFFKYIKTFFFALLLFSLISVVIDLGEKVDNFVDGNVPILNIVKDYYLNFVPYIVLMLAPIFIFISVLFFVSRMAYRSEIIASYSGGISFYRILFVPVIFAALILTALQLYANHTWLPKANQKRLDFESEFFKRKIASRDRNQHLQITKNDYVYVESFSTRDSTGYKFSLENFEDGKLTSKMRSEKIKWNKGKWKIIDYYSRTFIGNEEIIKKGKALDTVLTLMPKDFLENFKLREAMTTNEINKYLEKEKNKGTQGLQVFEVEKHKRSSIPFATIILTIIGYAIASKKMRGGMGLHLFFGALLSSTYVIFLQFSSTFSTNGNLPAFLGAWIPNIVFAFIALVLVIRAQK